MGKASKLGVVGTLAVAGALALSGGPAMAAMSWPSPAAYTCTGGDFATHNFTSIPSGTYASITVKGACAVAPNAVITVLGNINVAPGAALDAQSAPSTITVRHNVTAGPGSLLGLGCLPNPPGHTTGHPCTVEPNGRSDITVKGNVTAWDANTILLNGITVKRNVKLIGSEGTATVAERKNAIPWSIKDNTIGGDLIAGNMTPLWLGLLHNHVCGNVILFNVHITDGLPPNNDPKPIIFVASNTVGRNLACYGLAPAVSGGLPGEVNVVGGKALGQCAHLKNQPPGAG
jgi:hypothetical protein